MIVKSLVVDLSFYCTASEKAPVESFYSLINFGGLRIVDEYFDGFCKFVVSNKNIKYFPVLATLFTDFLFQIFVNVFWASLKSEICIGFISTPLDKLNNFSLQ